MSRSNSKRFVRAAWSLLFFQVIVSAGAVAVTGYAALYVQNLAPAQTASVPTATTATPVPAPIDEQAPAPPAADAAAPAPAPPAAASNLASVVDCPRVEDYWRVPAQAEWCDTGIPVKRGQYILVRVVEGQWSNVGPPSFRQGGIDARVADAWIPDAPLGALIGRVGDAPFLIGAAERVMSPADGHLLLAMNDAHGTYGDNQGALDLYVALH